MARASKCNLFRKQRNIGSGGQAYDLKIVATDCSQLLNHVNRIATD
jgi:hypothetical protein